MTRSIVVRDRSLAELARTIHAAGARDEEWPAALELLRHCLDAQVVLLARHEFGSGCESAILESPADAGFGLEQAAFAARNPWFLSSADYAAGRVMTGDELISNHDLRRTDFYRGFLEPRGLLHRLCGVVAQHPAGTHVCSAYRAEDAKPFGGEERHVLESVLDHIRLSLESRWRWQEAQDLSHALVAAAEHDGHPMLLLTPAGEVVFRNAAAEHILGQGAGLRLEGSKLVGASAPDRRLLMQALAQMDSADVQTTTPPRVLTLASDSSQPAMVVTLRAAGPVFMHRFGEHRNIVVASVRGAGAAHDPGTCVFARHYELTMAQAKVSAMVYAGHGLTDVAVCLHVSQNTVRSHLKQIFMKTETHSQMDLVHLHARFCELMP